jgi:ATP-dependent exoDNAse (exonuclease V) beta subunit
LGLEFKVVIVLWTQQFANVHASDPEIAAQERRKLYVAMTRAQEELYMFGSGNVPILNELAQNQYVDLEVIAHKQVA